MKKSNERLTGDELAVGGQAVLEGVMMRGKTCWCVSVRSNDGKIKRLKRKIKKKTGLSKILRKTIFIRGIFALWDSLQIGYRALDFSADVAVEEEGDKDNSNNDSFDWLFTLIILFLSIGLAIFLFKFLPYLISGFILEESSKNFVWIEGMIKILIFVGYILAISLSKQVRNVFEYHGAEHKVVHCYEKNKSAKNITPAMAKKFPCIHKRCGTTFIFLVIFISIVLYSLFPINLGFWRSFLLRILYLPLIAGIAFEILKIYPKLSNKNPLKWFLYLIEFPGMLLQNLTTREPNEKQLEVAIDSLKQVVD